MKLSKDLEGRVVTIQVTRPLYVIDYAGHAKYPGGTSLLLGEPILQGQGQEARPVAMDILIGVTVYQVHEDHVVVTMITPNNHRSRVHVPSSLIAQVAEMVDFEPNDLPQVTRQVRPPAGKPLVRL